MSPDELFTESVLRSLKDARLEAILVGNAACALQGVPVMTADLDFFVRDTTLNRKKIARIAERLGLAVFRPEEALSETWRLETKELAVDFVFRLGPRQTFERVRSRAQRIMVGGMACLTASLQDVLSAKKAAGRPKDIAALKIIEDTIRVRKLFS